MVFIGNIYLSGYKAECLEEVVNLTLTIPENDMNMRAPYLSNSPRPRGK